MATGKTTLNDRVWRALRDRLRGVAKKRVKIGWLDDGSQHDDISMAELAAIHEHGTEDGSIPAREPLRRTFEEDDGREDTKRMTERLARQVVAEKVDVDQALGILGDWGANQVKRRIKMGLWPPLKPATVAAKGSSAPLIDTGALVNAVNWVVVG